jgi:UDP-glucuronate 4-epimerase
LATLITGVAGFIGYHCARVLLERGESVIGVDNLNDYYAVSLKRARLEELNRHGQFRFHHLDIADFDALARGLADETFSRIIHLAAQPGVRSSLDNPLSYVAPNLVGHVNVLELCRRSDGVEHMVYASSSSVYGGNVKLPFSETDRVDEPISLYAATKRADELMSHTYAHLYSVPLTGLRFFTVYGPWGRPDMAIWSFTEAILEGRPIRLFNNGKMRRDFTFIDDIVAGVLAVLDTPPKQQPVEAPHRVYNIGNNRSEDISHLITVLEGALGREAQTIMTPAQPGEPIETLADITAIGTDFGFVPKTPIEVGVPLFVDWYRKQWATRLRD